MLQGLALLLSVINAFSLTKSNLTSGQVMRGSIVQVSAGNWMLTHPANEALVVPGAHSASGVVRMTAVHGLIFVFASEIFGLRRRWSSSRWDLCSRRAGRFRSCEPLRGSSLFRLPSQVPMVQDQYVISICVVLSGGKPWFSSPVL